jgi:hypothetical protein
MISKKTIMWGLAAAITAAGAITAYAQMGGPAHPQHNNKSLQAPGLKTDVPAALKATAKDPAGAPPNAKQIPFILPANIKWRPNGPPGTKPGEADIANVYGDPNKPGPYAVLYRWHQGAFSRPHFHDKVRHIVVVQGTWWVSTSSTYNEKLTFPLTAGATATDEMNAIHWDGSRLGDPQPAIIYLYGEGPVSTVMVDTNGKPYPLTK